MATIIASARDGTIGGLRVGEQPVGAAAAARHLTYNNGPLIENVEVFTIFWGDDWSNGFSALAGQLNQFFTDILRSSLMDQMGEFSVPGQFTIGHGMLTGTVTLPAGNLGNQIADPDIQAQIMSWINDGTVPQPNANTLYFVYFPPGVSVVLGQDQSCVGFCGYHDAIQGNTFYAVMPYPTGTGCTDNGNLSDLDALTATSSHELCDAVTDPAPPTGWYDTPNNMEIGDLCAWTFKRIGPWLVQLEWSNKAGACV